MAMRRPLVVIAGSMHELSDADELPPAKDLDLTNTVSQPDAIAVRVGGVWREILWEDFITLVGSPGLPPNAVLVGGSALTVDGVVLVANY